MEYLKKIYNKFPNFVYILAITLFVLLTSLLFKGHYINLLTDYGRELLFPEAILDGKVLYKDILCIYFPLAYFINAFAYKLFGISYQTIEYIGVFNGIIFSVLFFYISKEFFDLKFASLLTLATIFAVLYNGTLFNYIMPYSTSLTYGLTAYLGVSLILIYYLKYDSNKYIPLAYLLSGFALACKSEFLPLVLILGFVTFFYKKQSFKQNLINIFCYLIFPLGTLFILFYQGLTFADLFNAIKFMKTFFTTKSMIYHIGMTGGLFTLKDIRIWIESTLYVSLFFGICLAMYKLFSQKKILLYLSLPIAVILVNFSHNWIHTSLLPILVLITLIWKFNELKAEKSLFVLILLALALNLRTFWSLSTTIYGMFTAPLLIIVALILLFKFYPEGKFLSKEDGYKFIKYVTASYLLFFISFACYQKVLNNTPIETNRGVFYLPKKQSETISNMIKYIDTYSKPEQKILVLPEGTAINFFAKRPVDLRLHMADRLYFDAIGEKNILNNIKKNDYEMIFIIKGYGLTNFGNKYLYDDNSEILKYVKANYKIDWESLFYRKKGEHRIYCYVKPY